MSDGSESVAPGFSWVSNLLILILGFVMIIATVLTLAERKWSAMIQDRIGPNRARIGLPGLRNNPLVGLPHVISDSVKMLTKEDVRPKNADPLLFNLGPHPRLRPGAGAVRGHPRRSQSSTSAAFGSGCRSPTPTSGSSSVFAIASLAVYGTALAGWASNNKFALLGGVRATSQMVSYEVALGLGLVGMMLTFSTVRLPDHDRRPGALPLGHGHHRLGRPGAPGLGHHPPAGGVPLLLRRRFRRDQAGPLRRPGGRARSSGTSSSTRG